MIRERVREILRELPAGVKLLAAAKTRTPEEILEAVEAGITIVGENYVQEAERAVAAVGKRAEWHMIGHLQTNKVKKAVKVFDVIETVDSMRLAQEIDKCAEKVGRVMPVLIEVNSGEEGQKAGVMPHEACSLIREISALGNVRVVGLMTMGPLSGDPEESRPYFRKTKEIFKQAKALAIPGAEMKVLSMGMSDSYKVAVEEGATLVRVGTKIFGERQGPVSSRQ
jgi:PLP dependent protein